MQQKIPGMLLAAVIALAATFLGKSFPIVGGAVFAILIGMILARFSFPRTALDPGISFTAKYILQLAVVLLGFGMNLFEVLRVGAQSLPIIISTIATALIVSYLLQKKLDITPVSATLVGVGSSICGGSAIAATAPVVEAQEEEIAKAISVIFFYNVLAALLFPTLGGILGLTNEGFGIFAGTAINDTSSVTAAASTWDAMHTSNALDIATTVKLTRTLAILPITLFLAYRKTKAGGGAVSIKNVLPYFVFLFLAASILTTVLTGIGIDGAFFAPLKTLSKFCITMAMAAIGLNTDIVKLVKTGGSALALGGICWVSIAVVSLLMQHLMGIW